MIILDIMAGVGKDNKEIFNDVKVGDKLYDLKHGWGKVADTRKHSEIRVHFNHTHEIYKENGFPVDGVTRTLFWEKPDIIEKTRKIKKEIDVYVVSHSMLGLNIIPITDENKDDKNYEVRGVLTFEITEE